MLPPVCVKFWEILSLSFGIIFLGGEAKSSTAPKSYLHSLLDDIHSELFLMAPVALLSGTAVTFHEPDSWGCSSPFIDFPQKPYAEKKKTEKVPEMFAAKEQKQNDEFLPVPSETLAANLLNPRLSWPIGSISFYEEVSRAIEIKNALNCGDCANLYCSGIIIWWLAKWKQGSSTKLIFSKFYKYSRILLLSQVGNSTTRVTQHY